MNIQSYILDHWLSRMSDDHPVLTIYDPDGMYYEILELAEDKGVKVIDTTKGILHARLSASRYWRNDLALDKATRMLIYRKRQVPSNNRAWVEEPYSCFVKSGKIFPMGAQDIYENICKAFLPTKQKELCQLFDQGATSFNMINALLDGAAYPALEQLTKGKSFVEITVNLLSINTCEDMNWISDWQRFCNVQYPGLDSSGSILMDIQSKLWSYLLFSEFVYDLPESLPANLKSVPYAPEAIKDKIFMLCDKLRNQLNLRETYVRYANRISNRLRLEEVFANSKHLGERVTFSFENDVEFNRFITYLKEGRYEQAHKLYEKNSKDVWCQEEKRISDFWRLANCALSLIDCVNKGSATECSLKDLVKWYSESGCTADQAYRVFHTIRLGSISLPSQVKELENFVNTHYNEFICRGVREYQRSIVEIKNTPELNNQSFERCVCPRLKDGKRVVFIMVDALRYEMGKYFAQSIENSYKDSVDISPRISYLPSVTRFGMANHLGDIQLDLISDELQPKIGEDVISTAKDRVDYLKKIVGSNIQDFKLENFEATSVDPETRLLLIRSTGIDVAGENDKLNGLAAMDRELIQLAKMLDDCKRLEFDEAVIVTDHGFMIKPSFCIGDKIEKPVGSGVVLEESRVLCGNLNESADCISFTPEQLGESIPVMKISFAKDYTLFKKGDVYYHEGLSLQENIVPIITVKLQEEKKGAAFTLSMSYKGKTDGVIYSRRPIIDLHPAFSNLFAEILNIKLSIIGDNNEIIGYPEGMLYNSITECIEINPAIGNCRQLICIDDEYHGDNIVITAVNADTHETLSVLKLNFEND